MTGIIIGPRIGDLPAKLQELTHVRIVRTFPDYPTEADFTRYLKLTGPALVFLSTEDAYRAITLALAVDHSGIGTQIVAAGEPCDPQILLEIMRAGIREFVPIPIDSRRLTEAVARVSEVLSRKPLAFHSTDAVYSFLPAKPGDGTSTVVLNTGCCLARRPNHRTLIADFDLNLGMVSFLLKITHGHSVLDAVRLADRLDEDVWNGLITKREDLDVLCSGRLTPGNTLDSSKVEDVLHFAKRFYSSICLDFSGNMEPYCIKLLQQSKEIFVVCTSDVPSLHFARAKIQFLREAGLEQRASVLLNRSDRRNLFSAKDSEKLLGMPVRFTFSNDARRVSHAMRAGTSIEPKCELGRQFEAFVKNLTGEAPDAAAAAPEAQKKRFIEYFAVVPSTYHVDSVKRR
jgi:pilus assembly protein CpaE